MRARWAFATVVLTAAVAGAAWVWPQGSTYPEGRLVYMRYFYRDGVFFRGELVSRDLRTGNEKQLDDDFAGCEGGPPVSPDRRWVADCAPSGFKMVNTSTGRKKVVRDRRHIFASGWITGMGLTGFTQGKRSSVIEERLGSVRTLYQTKGWLFPPLIWISGNHFTITRASDQYASKSETLFVRVSDGGSRVIDGGPRRIQPMIGLPGAHLLYAASPPRPPRLGVLGLYGGRFDSVPFGPRTLRYGSAALGPGGQIAIVGSELHVVDAGGRAKRLARAEGNAAWLPDGQGLVYNRALDAHDGEIRVVDLNGHSRPVMHGGDIRVVTVVNR